jgi:hypothetical protein
MISASPPIATILSPRTANAATSGRLLCSVVALALCTIRSGGVSADDDWARPERGEPPTAIIVVLATADKR